MGGPAVERARGVVFDDEKVIDGLDRKPKYDANVLSSCSGEEVFLSMAISGTLT